MGTDPRSSRGRRVWDAPDTPAEPTRVSDAHLGTFNLVYKFLHWEKAASKLEEAAFSSRSPDAPTAPGVSRAAPERAQAEGSGPE